jgi:thiamine-phosphate diphosphorylase
MSVRLPPELLALTPGDLETPALERFTRRAASAVRVGLCGILLREALLSDREVVELASALRALLGPSGWLGLHDRPHLAEGVAADGVHLGRRSLSAECVRAWLEPAIAIGVSSHAQDAAQTWRGADYLLFAPVFDVPGKGAPQGLSGLHAALERSALPTWGLGGIAPESAASVRSAGAHGVAVLRGIFGSADPAAATEDYLRALAR